MNLKSAIGLAVAAGSFLIQAGTASAGTSRAVQRGETYCVQHGGVVQTRIPEYGTNGGNPLILAGSAEFCQFTKEKDGSQINVLLSMLESRDPTLAALA